MGATGLASNPDEYRQRLRDQPDGQLDAWAEELMRDIAKRRGVLRVLDVFKRTTAIDDTALQRVFAAGGGPPAAFGRDAQGHVIVPAITLFALVAGIRSQAPDARDRLIEYLVANFDELVYV